MEDLTNKYMYRLCDLHMHSTCSCEPEKAKYSPEKIALFYSLVKTNGKIAFGIEDHNSTFGAFRSYVYAQKHPEVMKKLDMVFGMELNIGLNNVITYTDVDEKDPQYLFKGMHLVVHAKPDKVDEFFERTCVLSELSHMRIKRDGKNLFTGDEDSYEAQKGSLDSNLSECRQYINIGERIIAARNLLSDEFGVRIPFDIYSSCIEPGYTYSQIRQKFISASRLYLAKYANANYNRRDLFKKIDDVITCKNRNFANTGISAVDQKRRSIYVFTKSPETYNDTAGLAKIDIRDLNMIFGDTATFCFAHPHTISFHKNPKIPVGCFKGVDLSILPISVQVAIKKAMLNKAEYIGMNEGVIGTNESGTKFYIEGDSQGLIKLAILKNQLTKMGIDIKGYEVVPRVAADRQLLEKCVKYASTLGLVADYGTDVHFKDEEVSSKYSKKKVCTFNPYLVYNRTGKIVNSQIQFDDISQDDFCETDELKE